MFILLLIRDQSSYYRSQNTKENDILLAFGRELDNQASFLINLKLINQLKPKKPLFQVATNSECWIWYRQGLQRHGIFSIWRLSDW